MDSTIRLTKQINSDWQKPRRFALRFLPAGYLPRYVFKKIFERASIMSSSYKDHKFSEAEILWMKEVYGTENFDPKIAKIKLKDKLPKQFNQKSIDNRFLIDGKKLTLFGLWHIEPQSTFFKIVEKVILGIRDIIFDNPGIEQISSEQISARVGLEKENVEVALSNLNLFGSFYSSAQHPEGSAGIDLIGLSGDEAYDAYLAFENLDQLLDETYKRYENVRENRQYSMVYSDPSFFSTGPHVISSSSEPQEDEIKKDTAFVLMAMDPSIYELVDVYSTIKDVCASFGINAYRADEIEHQDRITDLILSEIELCEFLIADLSYERPNVYYEIGYAHALDKRPILYRKAGTRLHFDLSVHNVPEYKNVTELKELLNKRFVAILGRAAK